MDDEILVRRAGRLVAKRLFLSLGLAGTAFAGEHNLGLPEAAGKAVYTAECGSCHIAYPPQLLSASGWARVIEGLDKHFGVDAGIDTSTAQTIGGYLRTHAGAERRFGTSALRISETPWFRKEHDEVPVSAWKSPQTKSAANCSACHTQAERGDFSERGLRRSALVWP